MLHAVCAVANIANGRVTHLDVAAAKAHPGVVEVMTPDKRAASSRKIAGCQRPNPFMPSGSTLLQNDQASATPTNPLPS